MIGILTFHWADDYGGMLQAYALKRRLEQLGEPTELIPYAPVKLTGRYWLCPLYAEEEGGKLRYYFCWGLFRQNICQLGRFWTRRQRMRRFRSRFLTAQLPVRRADLLTLRRYRTVVVGSDQVWNPELTAGLDDAYLGNLPGRECCRLVSYGASLGGTPLSEVDREKFIRYVGGFSAVSLREREDALRVGQLLGREVPDVLDPVFLLERGEWEQLARPPAEEGYILLCLTQRNEALLRGAQELAARLGRELFSLSGPALLAGASGAIALRTACGPEEFLGYIQNAGCVLTNSFHAAAFSILLEKPFLAVPHETRGVRQEALLRKLGLTSHLARTVQPDALPALWAQTDWAAVRARLDGARRESERFIQEQILSKRNSAKEQEAFAGSYCGGGSAGRTGKGGNWSG